MGSVTVDGVSLNYEQDGAGTDLVLVHGLGGDLHSWDADVPVFARHHRVLRLDVRSVIAARDVPGGTAPKRVAAALKQARQRLEDAP